MSTFIFDPFSHLTSKAALIMWQRDSGMKNAGGHRQVPAKGDHE